MTSDAAAVPEPPSTARDGAIRRQGRVGLGLAAAIIAAWLGMHVWAVFFYAWTPVSVALAPVVVAALCWLYVGLFIIAHDCMHGSLVPFSPGLNRAVGRLCLLLYAGFDYDRLNREHHRHHRHAGTGEDPDFSVAHAQSFWLWYADFFLHYVSWREILVISAIVWFYLLVLGAPLANLLAFWSLPAILSSVQLFYFGTYLPHRPTAVPFTDRHRTHSNDYPLWLSLLTCFHFGYHHAHHASPSTPWWRLPEVHREAHQRPEA
jgi:beta-carotene ketolase (CrtW type)